MSSSKFKIDNKELLRALGIAQTTRGRQHNRDASQYSMHQGSDSAFEATRKFDQSMMESNHVDDDQEDRGQFLFSLDIDITDDYKDFLDVYTNDKPYELARSFCDKHNIEKEIADIIAARIVENAKQTLLNRENAMSPQSFKEYETPEEESVAYNYNQMLPKGGDDSVDDVYSPAKGKGSLSINSPSKANYQTRAMTEKDTNITNITNIQYQSKPMFTEAKEKKSCEFLTSVADENHDTISRFNGSTKDSRKHSGFTPVFTEENVSPMRSHSKRLTTDRFYEKTLRDIENRVRKDAIIKEIHNQEKYKECTFHPAVNPVSLRLASNRKRDVSTEDLLLLKGKITEERRMIIKQNARSKENRNNTFRPEINEKSKHLDEKNRPNYEQRERFEDLYQEYRVLHEKRNQLRVRMSTEYSFNPNISNSKRSADKAGPKFLERLAEDIEKRKAKKENEEEPQEPTPTFCPKILKTVSDGSRNLEKLPVGEYLYKMSTQIENKKADLREVLERELRAKAPKCTEKSAEIIQVIIKRNLQTIFEEMDNDKDGLISADKVDMNVIPKELAQTFAPLFNDLKESKSEQNLSQFFDSCLTLLKTADPTVKTFVAHDFTKQIKSRNELLVEREQAIGMVFHPKIDKKSNKIASNGEERQGRTVHQRLFAEKAKSEIRLKELRDKATDEELKECSFRPIINKYAGCTEAFYEKVFARLDASF